MENKPSSALTRVKIDGLSSAIFYSGLVQMDTGFKDLAKEARSLFAKLG